MQQGGLSLQTLVIASMASMVAAIVVHEIWEGGAVLGAAVTPVIVAIVSETLRKPVTRVATRSGERFREAPPAPQAARADPFGIWQEDGAREPWHRRLDRRHLRLALITGALAFAVGAVALTVTEIVAGGNVGTGGNRVTLVPGDKDRDRDEPAPAQTTPATTVPATPQETVPPAESVPPAETAPAPAPTETAPAPTQPAPAPEAPE